MLVVTNYPQVPIATSNVATDAARVDNQQRPPIIPPKEATKGHEERSFNPQNERITEQEFSKNLERVNQKQQQQGSEQQQQHEQKSKSQADQLLAQLRKKLPAKPALQRQDIRIFQQYTAQSEAASQQKTEMQSVELTHESFHFYQDFGKRIGAFYQQQAQVAEEPMISDWS